MGAATWAGEDDAAIGLARVTLLSLLPPPPEPEALRDNAPGGGTLWWLILALLVAAGATFAIVMWRRRRRALVSQNPPGAPPPVEVAGLLVLPDPEPEPEPEPPAPEPPAPSDELLPLLTSVTLSRPTFRLEHWRGGEATAVAYTDDPDAHELILAAHAARLREEQATGELVWIEEATDEIVALHPLNPDDPFSARAARFL
ncbi:MAG: hypothetical protein M3R06_07380 [Chloroflexota bacterium]|nr:hypothetical protein [Chloroflexota bacterium]